MALFLHDIAKGRPEDHSLAGAAIARKLGPRFGLDAAETDTVAWLVEHHLLMSITAQSRDLSDPRTIEGFARVVQTLERLKLLLVLTVADIKAVGPGVWNGWKGQLLRTLYYETEVVLGGGHSETGAHGPRQAGADAACARRCPTGRTPRSRPTPPAITRPTGSRWTPPGNQARPACPRRPRMAGRTVATSFETDAFRGVTELTVLAPDHPAAACHRHRRLRRGRAATSSTPRSSRRSTASRSTRSSSRAPSTATRTSCAAPSGWPARSKARSRARSGSRISWTASGPPSERPKPFQVAPEVVIDNALSTRHTVLEVTGLDRPGLLYDLTTALGKLNLNIASAHIATFGEKAVDVFYVTDLTGTKVTHPGRQGAIRRALLEIFEGESAAESPLRAAGRGA